MNFDHVKPIRRCLQPKRHRMALLTFVGLLVPVYFVPPALIEVFNGSRLFTVSAVAAVIVVLMTYIIMPILTFIAADWLCGRQNKKTRNSENKS